MELSVEVERRFTRYVTRLFSEAGKETAQRKLLDLYQLISSRGETALSVKLITNVDTFEFALEAYGINKGSVPLTYILSSFNSELGGVTWKKMT